MTQEETEAFAAHVMVMLEALLLAPEPPTPTSEPFPDEHRDRRE